MHPLVSNLLHMLAYGVSAAIIMSLTFILLTKIWHWFTPIDEWEELRKGNVAVAIVFAAIIIGFAIVVSVAISPGG